MTDMSSGNLSHGTALQVGLLNHYVDPVGNSVRTKENGGKALLGVSSRVTSLPQASQTLTIPTVGGSKPT